MEKKNCDRIVTLKFIRESYSTGIMQVETKRKTEEEHHGNIKV